MSVGNCKIKGRGYSMDKGIIRRIKLCSDIEYETLNRTDIMIDDVFSQDILYSYYRTTLRIT